MPLITEELSVWDIGLRWAGHDPDCLWLRLPLAAKDNFRLLMEAILSGEIICNTLTLAKLPPDSKADPRFYIRTYIDEVYDCIHGQRYNRKLLKWATLDRKDFHEWCERRGITPPEFWFSPGWKLDYDVEQFGHPGLWVRHVEPEHEGDLAHFAYERDDAHAGLDQDVQDAETTGAALRVSQRLKLVCQQIATVIWKEDKTRTIASVVRDELIQKYGGAAPYNDDTVREWIKEVAPLEVRNKRGRPRKNGDAKSEE